VVFSYVLVIIDESPTAAIGPYVSETLGYCYSNEAETVLSMNSPRP
jgi:hypothetical protein